MDFEFDEKKSQINAKKHGINFEEAQFLWCDARRVVVEARSSTEPRFALMALLGGKIWTAIYTMREERIRTYPRTLWRPCDGILGVEEFMRLRRHGKDTLRAADPLKPGIVARRSRGSPHSLRAPCLIPKALAAGPPPVMG